MLHSGANRKAPAEVLCLSGLDPTGGAGLQADIEACTANDAHALGVATALTVQDSRNVSAVEAVSVELLQAQLDTLLADCQPTAVKLGLIGDADQIPLFCRILARLEQPVVCDPILRAGGGTELLEARSRQRLFDELLPQVMLLTPNAAEARRLIPDAGTLDACGAALLAAGCHSVLITGGDEPGTEVVNTLYRGDQPPRHWRWPRLPGTFHGAGCTLSAAIAARLANGDALEAAVSAGQAYSHKTLEHAFPVGRGRPIPGRNL